MHVCDEAFAGKPCTGKLYTRFDEGSGVTPAPTLLSSVVLIGLPRGNNRTHLHVGHLSYFSGGQEPQGFLWSACDLAPLWMWSAYVVGIRIQPTRTYTLAGATNSKWIVEGSRTSQRFPGVSKAVSSHSIPNGSWLTLTSKEFSERRPLYAYTLKCFWIIWLE